MAIQFPPYIKLKFCHTSKTLKENQIQQKIEAHCNPSEVLKLAKH